MSFEQSGNDKKASKPTKAPVERDYPVPWPESRDVAIRRLAYRGIKAPIEYEIWLEFKQFPEVLDGYPDSVETEAFERRRQAMRGQREIRLYGEILTPIQRGPSAADGSPPHPSRGPWRRKDLRALADRIGKMPK